MNVITQQDFDALPVPDFTSGYVSEPELEPEGELF